MPGIITHNKCFVESINYLKKEKQKNTYSRSIEALFRSESFLKAGLFGAIGPNIFDYLPFLKKNYICGSNISYELHTAASERFLQPMLAKLLSYKDQNTEWASIQKAYLYGFISHLISDSIFHPYVYYWSGLLNSVRKKVIANFREQYLSFEYNIDLYFSQYYDENDSKNRYNFNLNDMLPLKKKGFQHIEQAIKVFLLNSIKEANMEFYSKLIPKKKKNNEKSHEFLIFDAIPAFIRLSYKIKRSRNPQLLKIINFIKRKNLFYSDYLVKYPSGKVNTHILNLHKERWFHPTGVSGLHYESVRDLLAISCMKTANTWKKIEEILYRKKDISEIGNDFKINAVTGIIDKDFTSMHLQNPVRPRF